MECRVDYTGKGKESPEKTTNEKSEPPKEGSQQTIPDMMAAAIKEGIKDALREIEGIKNGMRTDAAASLASTQAAPYRQSAFPKESTIWDVYVNEAKSVDKELVDEWRSSLNFLLVFATIFAAVLTAFIIESKKLLEQDPQDLMVDIMMHYVNGRANGTLQPYVQPQFTPERPMVNLNYFFFASLSTSLVAALASVIALQWVTDYDVATSRIGSSPKERAKQRHFRYIGVTKWKMGEIVALLPLLLYGSVALFFTGLIQWMRIIHHDVGTIILGGAAMAIAFFGISTILSICFVTSPFRTPLARYIYALLHIPFSIAFAILSITHPSPEHKASKPSHLQPSAPHESRLVIYFTRLRIWMAAARRSLRERMSLDKARRWLNIHRFSIANTSNRDNRAIVKRSKEKKPSKSPVDLDFQCLIWLSKHISISQDTYDHLILFLYEMSSLKRREQIISEEFQKSQWLEIVNVLLYRYETPQIFKMDTTERLKLLRSVISLSTMAPTFEHIVGIRDKLIDVLFRLLETIEEDKIPYMDLLTFVLGMRPVHPVTWSDICSRYTEEYESRYPLIYHLQSRDWIASLDGDERRFEVLRRLHKLQKSISCLKPLWRTTINSEDEYNMAKRMDHEKYNDFCLEAESEQTNLRLAEALSAFDKLVANCDKENHQIIVDLLCHDLSMIKAIYNTGEGYLTDERRSKLEGVNDPFLQILASAVTGMDWKPLPLKEELKKRTSRAWVLVSEFVLRDQVVIFNKGIWKLRSLLWPYLDKLSASTYLRSSLKDVQKMCSMVDGFSQPDQEYKYGGDRVLELLFRLSRNPSELNLSVSNWGENPQLPKVDLILALLMPRAEGSPLPKLDKDSEPVEKSTLEVIDELCQDVKRDPARIIALMAQITSATTRFLDISHLMAIFIILDQCHTLRHVVEDSVRLKLARNLRSLRNVGSWPSQSQQEQWTSKLDCAIRELEDNSILLVQ